MKESERKNAVVTGSNRGLGKAVIKKLAEKKYNIWACTRKRTTEFESYLSELAMSENIDIKPVYFELTVPEEVKQGYKEICEEHKNIDVLINNAGIGHMDLFQMTKMSRIREIFEVNLFAPMELTQMVIRNMCRQKSGKIINVSSTAANEIYVGNSIYGATKAALSAFTQSLAAEVYQYGITVNAIAPGLIDTDMSAVFEGKNPDIPIQHTALGRKIYPEEVADILVELLSDKMNIINGEVICINGGHK